MSFLRRTARALGCGLFFCATMILTGTAAAVSWTYLNGPFGGLPLALFSDAAGNTWAGLNGSGVYYRAAGTSQWVERPGLPTQSNAKFAIGGTGIVYVSGSSGVYALAVGGTTWQQVDGDNGLPGGAGGGMTTDTQGAVYVGTDGNGVYKLSAGGTTWTEAGTGFPGDGFINNLVFDGAGNLWVSVYDDAVYKLPAGGGAWVAMSTGLDNPAIQGLAVVGNDLFAGVQFGGAYKLANASGGGSTWVAWNGGSLSMDDAIYGFARGAGNTLYAAGYSTVYALAGGASTWTDLSPGLNGLGPTYAIAYSAADGSLTVGNGSGTFTLAAGAGTWQLANSGMTASTIYGLVAAANGDLYAATFGQGIQRLASGGSTWTAVDPAHSSPVAEAIAIDGQGTIFASSSGNVIKLTGGTWSPAGNDLNGFAYALAVDAANAVWAGQSGSVTKLPPGTSTWVAVGSGLPPDGSVNALAFDGGGAAYAGIYGTGIFVLPSGGATWTLVVTGLLDMSIQVLRRDASGAMFAGTQHGVYKLVSGTWQLVGTGLTAPIYALAFDTNGDLYAGVDNGYAWRLAAGKTVWAQVRTGLTSRTATAFAVSGGRLYAGTDASRGSPSGVFVFVPLDTVIEFYNDLLDNFFITANPDEQAAVANGAAGPGWSTTGDFFNAGGPLQVCRFYGSLQPGPNSHFYTIDPAECQTLRDLQAATPSTQKRWNFESYDFSSASPVGGQCTGGQVPVYRAYNNGFTRNVDSNHRITANHASYLAQVGKGWTGEGIVMCAPAQ